MIAAERISDLDLTDDQRREIARAVKYEIVRATVARRLSAAIGESVAKSLNAATKIIDAALEVPHGRR